MKRLISFILLLTAVSFAAYPHGGSSNCSTFSINGLAHGTHVDSMFMPQGVSIIAIPNSGGRPDAVIYNTNGHWMEDPDLNVHQGNVIIINENPKKPDGDGDGPDDNATGGKLRFLFNHEVKVESFIAVDVEENGAYAKAYNAYGSVIKTVSIPPRGNGSVQTVVMNASGTKKLEIVFPGSCAVRLNLSCPCNHCGWKTEDASDQMVTEEGSFMMNAYPNPFQNEVKLDFRLATTTKAKAEIYSTDGRKMVTLFDAVASEGETYYLKLDGSGLAEGMYFYRLTTEDGQIYNTKLLLVR